MRAISVKQPFANLVAAGLKTAEARGWRTRHRGPILIVSSLDPWIEPAGCAVAVARVADVQTFRAEHGPAALVPPGRHGCVWLLQDVRAVRPFPVRGRPGLYEAGVRFRDLEFVAPPDHGRLLRVRVELAREGLGADGVERTRMDVATLAVRAGGMVRTLHAGVMVAEVFLRVPASCADLIAERWRESVPSPIGGA